MPDGPFFKTTPIRSQPHRTWVCARPCAVRGSDCRGAMHAHHVRDGTGGGTSMKPGDEWCVCLCTKHHDEVHHGALTFAARYGVDLRDLASLMARRSPHLKGKL